MGMKRGPDAQSVARRRGEKGEGKREATLSLRVQDGCIGK